MLLVNRTEGCLKVKLRYLALFRHLEVKFRYCVNRILGVYTIVLFHTYEEQGTTKDNPLCIHINTGQTNGSLKSKTCLQTSDEQIQSP